MTASSLSPTPVLNIEEVSLIRGGRALLDRVSLRVNPGERWAVIGANGAGKSTLLSLCGAVVHPSRGEVSVLGRRLGRVDIRELRALIGHVNPRHPLHSRLRIEDVILTGLTGTVERMLRWEPSAGQRVRARELAALLGLESKLDATWDTLSQGERGRTLIARALVTEPALLLLDEPSTGLDVAARERLLATLDVLVEDNPLLATLLVTHHLEELPRSTTHALLVRDGIFTSAGPVQEVLTSERVSECFDYPIRIAQHNGRWVAQAL
ncbi:ABC transporter ATP-binding protein [Mycetocola spongiae]|uniref:ABC transporter ATP-binding protein n=1 Tax=Mycetocola spongiae TaxID=2859226 RepID=UPI001CF5B623|nr:ATP-binding cassette domain-containing protein [Mycetocola spongiae]UCR90321.1 ATP-binding cassette domain-containing protein [Mycetocola spongiae]